MPISQHDYIMMVTRLASRKQLRTGAAESPNAQSRACSRPPSEEADLHDEVEKYCRSKGWLYIHPRMDQKSTISTGWPDFSIFMDGGKTVCLELKRPGAKPTHKQLQTLAHLRKLGHLAACVDRWEDALLLLR